MTSTPSTVVTFDEREAAIQAQMQVYRDRTKKLNGMLNGRKVQFLRNSEETDENFRKICLGCTVAVVSIFIIITIIALLIAAPTWFQF